MEARISLVTLAVADLARARRFYVDGLGWTPAVEGDDVVMIQTGDRLLLSLWARASFEAEVGPIASGPGLAPSPSSTTAVAPPRSTRCSRPRAPPAPTPPEGARR